ncbi:hypothetical protein LTR56_009061 [Elasticomyces elasticus]|nr:hypothetical protein LTR56_009061 [Elasticomyces elasticus]KAK3663861.1 hypothetical protein LTR22_005322 [Elasticomyces elasticus]KAK4923929.1 hypothetical protein LTR49_008874 [Elasticomyces elasticus]KAK5762194.1 hypothetical protein LTS12_007715 [Elasticomyces elasticus]
MLAATRPGALQTWLQAPAESKRKRDSTDDHNDDDEGTSGTVAKKTSASKTARPKKQAKPAVAAKPTNAASKNTSKEAKKLYKETLKAVEKRHIELDKKVKAMSPNSRAITVTNYTTSAAKHLPTVKKLDTAGETVLAFNFAMALADASHRNITTSKFSGEGGSCVEAFKKMDAVLLALINKREKPSVQLNVEDLPEVPHRWTDDDAEVGVFKTGRPNKQQRNAMERQEMEWEKERRAERRGRREEGGDWVQMALVDLKADRDELVQFGVGVLHDVKGSPSTYFAESIARLEEFIAEREAAAQT